MNNPRRVSAMLALSATVAHHRHLAESLASRGLLRRAVLFGPGLSLLEPDSVGALRLRRNYSSFQLCNRLLWGVWRRLPLVPRVPLPLFTASCFVDWALSKALPKCSIYHGLTGVCLSSLRQAKRAGAIAIVDTATLHPLAWQREVLTECAANGIRPRDCERFLPQAVIRRQEREYHECDWILVYSSASQRSFEPHPYANKTVVVHPGIDHRFFTPGSAETRTTFRVCYVGRVEPAKGVNYLIEAWRRLALPHAELVLAGRMLPGVIGLDANNPAGSIALPGILAPGEVAECYRNCDLFVFPSVNEGLSLSLLEAMSSGLPVIACKDTGAEDCVTPQVNGILVPGRNAAALADAISWCYGHREDLLRMGISARQTIEAHFTLSHYTARVEAVYAQTAAGA